MEILRVENLCKTYGKGENEVKALDNVSFSINKGDFIAIIGPSGSGKSTLLHILGGVDKPTSGKVYMDNCDVYKQSDEQLAIFRRRQVGLIYQFYNLIPVLNVTENITLPVLMDGHKVNDDHLKELLNTLKLVGRENHLPNQLSGGQQQRVSIARALALQPKILFFDEPTSALDPELTGEVLKVIRQLAKEHMTMIIVTHEMQFARELSDRIIFMEQGIIQAQGTPEEIFASDKERVREFIGKFQS